MSAYYSRDFVVSHSITSHNFRLKAASEVKLGQNSIRLTQFSHESD